MNTETHFTPEYSNYLADSYDAGLVAQLDQEWSYADLSHLAGEQIPYVRLDTPDTTGRPILFVPGFTETIVAKAPLILEMAQNGADMIMPGQNRVKIAHDRKRHLDATNAQAQNNLAILVAEGLEDQTVDIITHSYGSLVFQEMHKLAQERGIRSFEGSKVVMLAPAGFNQKESALKLGYRFAKSLILEAKTSKDVDDIDGSMFKAGQGTMTANIPRGLHEIRDLYKSTVDYERLLKSGIASLAVLGYAEDAVYPHKVLERTMRKAVESGVSYGVPVSLQVSADGMIRSGTDASHNDDQFNPSRAAGAALQLLQA